MQDITNQIQEIGRRYSENYPLMLNRSAELAGQGWLLIPTMTPREIDLLDISDIDEYFLNYYSKNEEYQRLKFEVLNHILFRKHRSLLEECMYCYEKQKYKIIIPAAFSVLEGVVAELSKSDKWGSKLMKDIECLVESETCSIRLLVLSSILVFIKQIFQNHNFTGERLEIINRNWILHGRDTVELWTKSDALKLLNAFYSLTLL